MKDAYKDAGVDIDAGEALVERIKPMAASTSRPGVLGGLGGFGGLFALRGYSDPVLVSGTDGVGTKLLLAQQLGRHDTVGIDLVAMCVNDIVVTGAEPLFFLDYVATGALDQDALADVISGIAEGCRQAGCALLGGETAEMPGMYGSGHYDLAGFAVGAVERARILDPARVSVGDALVGLPSTGIHSNGFSLVRKVVEGLDMGAEHGLGRPLGEVLLAPTRIYVKTILALLKHHPLHGIAHITGGGIPGNLPRVLPSGLGARLDRSTWDTPPIFSLLQEHGDLSARDMARTFNLGLGMILVVPSSEGSVVAEATGGSVIGEVTDSGEVTW